jgi:hypothetical protein
VQPRHPIRLIAHDDLQRSRLTVFFRLLLVIPHLFWVALWSIAVLLVMIVNWFITLSQGRTPDGIHNWIAAYVRYVTQVNAYLYLGANPYPEFGDWGGPGASYPVDLEVDPPAPQNRWKTAFRIVLAVPALLLASALGSGSVNFAAGSYYSVSFGVLGIAAVLAWFAILARGQMPRGLSQLIAYALSYSAQVGAYLLLLTDRYPDCDPQAVALPAVAPRRALRVNVADDLARSRLTVFFRLLLTVPHFVWLALWGIVVLVAVVVNWFATLFRGRSPQSLHDFIARYVRYALHVNAFLFLVANPFPGFGGRPGSYPIDLEVDPPEPQGRWRTFFRGPLAVPSALLGSALSSAAATCALLGWFASLATGRMPRMLRNLAAFALAYQTELYGYAWLLTERYPYSGPVFAPEPEPMAAEAAIAA